MSIPNRHACLINAAARLRSEQAAQDTAEGLRHATAAIAWLLMARQDEPVNPEDAATWSPGGGL